MTTQALSTHYQCESVRAVSKHVTNDIDLKYRSVYRAVGRAYGPKANNFTYPV
jgi:hypothetical protein